jgi:flagellar hook-length control protein FliK
MPKTSAISLFPLPSKTPSASCSNAQLTDTSFEQTLESARQRKTSRPTDADGSDDNKAEKPEKSAAVKKPSKSGKPKRSNTSAAKSAADDKDDADVTSESQPTAASTPATPDDNADPKAVSTSEADKEDSKKAAASEADPTATVVVQPLGGSTSSTTQQVKEEDSAAHKEQHGTVVVEATKTAAKADGADGSQPATADDADVDQEATANAEATGNVAAAIKGAKPASAKSAGLGTAKVTAHGLLEGENQSDGNAAVSSAVPDPASVTTVDASDFDDILTAAGTVLGSDEQADHLPRTSEASNDPARAVPFEQHLQQATGPTKAEAPAPATPEAQFVDANHPKIITGVRSELLPNGGTMQIRLDPPELGALQVTVHMRDGVMTAAFETSNDDATRMLSHSLNQLKTVLESAGVNVEKLHVQQSPKQESQSGQDQQQQGGREQQQEARQEQQRREMLQRMWRKLSGGADPIDLVA